MTELTDLFILAIKMFYLGVQNVDQRGEFIFLFLHFFLSFLFVIGKDVEEIQKVGKNCNSVNRVNFLFR